jgi:hypothetical protein
MAFIIYNKINFPLINQYSGLCRMDVRRMLTLIGIKIRTTMMKTMMVRRKAND